MSDGASKSDALSSIVEKILEGAVGYVGGGDICVEEDKRIQKRNWRIWNDGYSLKVECSRLGVYEGTVELRFCKGESDVCEGERWKSGDEECSGRGRRDRRNFLHNNLVRIADDGDWDGMVKRDRSLL